MTERSIGAEGMGSRFRDYIAPPGETVLSLLSIRSRGRALSETAEVLYQSICSGDHKYSECPKRRNALGMEDWRGTRTRTVSDMPAALPTGGRPPSPVRPQNRREERRTIPATGQGAQRPRKRRPPRGGRRPLPLPRCRSREGGGRRRRMSAARHRRCKVKEREIIRNGSYSPESWQPF